MDVRSSQLIVVLFLVFAAVVSVVTFLGFRNKARYAALLELERQRVEREHHGSDLGRNIRRQLAPGTRRRIAVNDETRTVKRLREMLNDRAETLQRQSNELQRAKVEHENLQAEYEQLRMEYERILQQADWQLASIVSEVWQNISDDNNLTQTAAMEEDLLQTPLANADSLTPVDGSPDPETDLAVAEWELGQARARIVQLELTVLREIARSATATEAIIAIGPSAVPSLVEALSDVDPEIRRWAATVLGRMRQDATDAIDSLRQTMRDMDPDVAQAAKEALDQIQDRF